MKPHIFRPPSLAQRGSCGLSAPAFPFAPSSIHALRWSHFLLSLDQPWVFIQSYTCRAGPAWFFSLPRCMPSFPPRVLNTFIFQYPQMPFLPQSLSRPLLGNSIMLDCLHGIHTPYILDVCVNVSCRGGFIHRCALSPALCLTQNRVSVHLGLCDTPLSPAGFKGLTQYVKGGRINETEQQNKGCKHKRS